MLHLSSLLPPRRYAGRRTYWWLALLLTLFGTGLAPDAFAMAMSYATGPSTRDVAAGDFKVDGRLDLVTANGNTAAAPLTITYAPPATVVSVTGTTPSPTATATVSYRVVFSAPVTGLTIDNFIVTTDNNFFVRPSVTSVSGSGTTYTVVVNTGDGSGTLRLNVANSTNVTPSITGLPTANGDTYTIYKRFPAGLVLLLQAGGSASGKRDVTAFVDQVKVFSGNSAFDNGLQNGSFEANNVDPRTFKQKADGVVATPWSFSGLAGVSRNDSPFGSVTSEGDAVGLVQTSTDVVNGTDASISQQLAVPTGSYRVSFRAAQRTNNNLSDQVVNVFLFQFGTPVFLGSIQPNSDGVYEAFHSATFSVTAPAVTTTVTSATAPNGSTSNAATLSYTVTFSQSVGTTFTADDVTVSNGTLTGFAGSGTTYTFSVTPSSSGPVRVSVASGVAQDANNTTNQASEVYTITNGEPTATVVSVTGLTPSPTATATVSYRVTFSSSSFSVTGVSESNFSVTSTTGATVSSVSGSGTTYTVVVNTGSGDGTLRLNVANSTGITPTVTNTPYTGGTEYTITRNFAAAPTLSIQAAGSASNNGDVTAFVDVVQVLQSGSSTVVANGIQNGSFETNNVAANGAKKTSDGVEAAPWRFTGTSGVSRNGSPFGSVAAEGNAVALVQSAGNNNASLAQNLAVPTGSYQVSFRAVQRNYSAKNQRLNVFVDDVFVGNIQPNSTPTYDTFTSATFNVTAPALTATVSSATAPSGSTSNAATLSYTVTFSQSVGTTFTADDLTVSNGTLSDFAGSGTTYTFSVTPSSSGPVRVSVADGVAQDANNTTSQASEVYSITYTSALTWTGAVSTAWATAGNWSPAQVPTIDNDVTIPAGPANQPVVSGDQTARNLDLATGAHLTLAAGSELTVGTLTTITIEDGNFTLASGSFFTQLANSEIYLAGNLTNNGATFALDPTSEVAFGGPTHLFNGTTGMELQTMTLGERGSYDIVELRVPVRIRRKLAVYNNSTTFQGPGGSLTLLSDASGTALIENGSASYVLGPITLQRYLNPQTSTGITYSGLGYRHYSSPMNSSTVADLATAGFTPEVSQAQVYNTSATPGQVKPFPTVFGYEQERVTMTSTYKPFDRGFFVPEGTGDNKNAPLEVGRGYAVHIKGTEKVDFTGTPNTGNINLSLSRVSENADAGWALVGNPYPSPLDGSLLLTDENAPGLDQSFYVVESTGPYAGMYRSYVAGFGGAQNPLIAMGQGFFVRVSQNRTSGQLRFRNAQRITEFDQHVLMHRGGAANQPTVSLTLRGATGPADKLFVYADAQATAGFDGRYDAWKLPNSTGLNLSSRSFADQDLSIDGRPTFTTATLVALAVGVPAAGTYTISAASLSNLPAGLDAYLSDAATGQTVQLAEGASYSFSVTAAQSVALLTNRFTLSFNTGTALATAPAELAAQVSVYPNPATGRFAVTLPAMAGARTVEAALLNSLGQVVRRQSVNLRADGAHFEVEAEGLSAGVYSLRLTAGATTIIKRVVLQ
ncbi:Ig-like domain-containing protein [Hymenobacter guriensis]|uniref:T9SS type A sorting domain-containing protein n=1 Tax=Hymenobacter guriensis TaxID=2793065 RepID=A0ABS0L879_9BACT|nr:Ig-like domain-containing protein [Hymenobacter guriensis]MBG8556110.1 T9SS type A sorting domain-containing protein [Hymenobacter guriensis]